MLASLRTRIANWLDIQWQHQGLFCLLMMPFSLLVMVILTGRRGFYRVFSSRIYRAPVPVVVIGNIYVGGTGKTPVVMTVVQALKGGGWRPGVLSRGYGIRIGKSPRVGRANISASQFGDEPALIAKETGAPVAVHPNRQLAIETLLARYPDVNIIVSDDGLQHIALARDIEIVVQDARGVANQWVMPAGPLRESAHRLDRVDVIVTQGDNPALLPNLAGVKQVTMKLDIVGFRHLVSGETLTLNAFKSRFQEQTLNAAAGIGSPEKFFTSLRQAGLRLTDTLPLPDHHALTATTFDQLNSRVILITAKDAIKCETFADDRLWVVEVTPRLSDPDFATWLNQKLQKHTHDNTE